MTDTALVEHSDLFGALNEIEQGAQHVLERIPAMDDEKVMQLRQYAETIGRLSWLVVCHCDAEMVNRIEKRQGVKDVDGSGRTAQIVKYAAEVGRTRQAINNNKRVYETFFSSEVCNNVFTNLEEKSYYVIALNAPDPHAALEHIASRKAEDTFYSVRDAYEDIRMMQARLEPLSAEPQRERCPTCGQALKGTEWNTTK